MTSPLSALGLAYLLAAADYAPADSGVQPETDIGEEEMRLVNSPVPVSPGWGGGYPRVIRLRDGSLLGSVTAYQGGVNRLRVTRSTNNGASFTDIGEIAAAASGSHDLDNTHIV
ncbi:MAG: hypothetical protein EOO77_08265, partial [Oxalobacteraceae bacterium]